MATGFKHHFGVHLYERKKESPPLCAFVLNPAVQPGCREREEEATKHTRGCGVLGAQPKLSCFLSDDRRDLNSGESREHLISDNPKVTKPPDNLEF